MSTMTQKSYQMRISKSELIRVVGVGGMIGLCLISSVSPGLAQERTGRAQAPSTITSPPKRDPWSIDPRMELPSDTGRFVAAYKSFERYQYPQQCLALIERERYKVWTRHETPWRYESLLYDTLPEAVVELARVCIAKFPIDKLANTELRSLYRIARSLRDTAIARSVLDRLLLSATTDSARALILERAILDDFENLPVDIKSVMVTLARLDSLGRPAALSRVRAHSRVIQHAYQLFDRPLLWREIEAWKAAFATLSHAERSALDILSGNTRDGFAAVWSEVMTLHRFEDKIAELDSFYAWLKPLMQNVKDLQLTDGDWATIYGAHTYRLKTIYGASKPAEPISAWRWLTAEGVKANSQPIIRPTSGKASLFFRPIGGVMDDGSHAAATMKLQRLRELIMRYAPLGLEVTVVVPIPYHPVISFEESAELLRRRLFESQMLPPEVVVAVDTLGHTFLPEPDGRIQSTGGFSLNSLFFVPLPGSNGKAPIPEDGYLVDRNGKIVYIWKDSDSEHVIEAHIRKALGLPIEDK